MHGTGVAPLQVELYAAAQTGRQADALQPVVAGGGIQPFIQTLCMNLHKTGLVQLNLPAVQVQQLAAQLGAVCLRGGGDKCHCGVFGVEMVFAHGASTAGGYEFTREEAEDMVGRDMEVPEWDGYERSVLAKLADDVKVSIKGQEVDMTVSKSFA